MTHRFLPIVEKNCCAFARAGLAVASMKGKSYLSLGGVSMVSPVPLLITTSLNPGWE
ncbi:L-fucose isomerase [Escherichia coli]|uniref:L-fucose isomerase n=1 Tax=Escherichia coli TaxID=562 RepID=A0A2X1N6W3_ECOLX|nr:L-fucose isomerase [Escherichia coli]